MPALHLASFGSDVTPPAGHPLCGGWIEPVRGVDDPLRALGVVLKKTAPLTHQGLGQARVEQVASNRRILGPDHKVRYTRTSATGDPKVRAEPEGLIDPWLKTLSFWDGDRPLAALHDYATHPM